MIVFVFVSYSFHVHDVVNLDSIISRNIRKYDY